MHAGVLLTHLPPQLLDQVAPRCFRRQRHQLAGRADIPSPAHGLRTGRGRPIASTGKRPAGRLRLTRHQDIRMHPDRPVLQNSIDARGLRRGGALVREERRQRRQVHRRRPPGDHLARHDVPTAHAAQVAIGRPAPLRPHWVGARPSPSVRVGRRVTGTSSKSTVTAWLRCARIRRHVRTLLQVGRLVGIRAVPAPAGALPGDTQPTQDAGDPAQRGVAPPR